MKTGDPVYWLSSANLGMLWMYCLSCRVVLMLDCIICTADEDRCPSVLAEQRQPWNAMDVLSIMSCRADAELRHLYCR